MSQLFAKQEIKHSPKGNITFVNISPQVSNKQEQIGPIQSTNYDARLIQQLKLNYF